MPSPSLELNQEEIQHILLDWLVVLEEQDFDSLELPDGFEAKQKEHEQQTSKLLEYDFLWDRIAEKHNQRSPGKVCTGLALKTYMEEHVSEGYEYMESMDMRKYAYDFDEESGGRRYTTVLVRDDAMEEPFGDADMTDEPMADDDQQLNQKCGLFLPVARIQQQLEEYFQEEENTDEKDDKKEPMEVDPSAGIMLTAVAEYLVAEVMELAGNQALDNSRKHINSMDICYAIVNDNENGGGLANCFTEQDESNEDNTVTMSFDEAQEARPVLQKIEPSIPSCLTDADSGAQTRIDVYWRTTGRFPGGNCDIFTVRYRLIFDPSDPEPKAHRIEWRNYDCQQSIESGYISRERAAIIISKLEELDWKSAVIKLHQSLPTVYSGMRSAGSHYNILDEKSRDNNAYDTEWSSTEILVYHQNVSNPFLRLCRNAVMGPQYSPNSGHYKHMMEGTKEQRTLVDMMTEAIGMGRPEEFSESKCPAGSDRGRTHTLPMGIPYSVYPEFFLY